MLEVREGKLERKGSPTTPIYSCVGRQALSLSNGEGLDRPWRCGSPRAREMYQSICFTISHFQKWTPCSREMYQSIMNPTESTNSDRIDFFLINVCKKHTGPVLYHIKVVHSTEPIQAPTRRVQRGQLSTPSYTKDLAKTEKYKQAQKIFCACQSRRSPPSDTAMAIDRAG